MKKIKFQNKGHVNITDFFFPTDYKYSLVQY